MRSGSLWVDESTGTFRVPCASTLDEALVTADLVIQAFVGKRPFVISATRADPLLQMGGGVLGWDVEVHWRVTS